MPFYEYECSACKFYVETLQKISDAPLRKCPSCKKQTMKRLISAPVFRLKGAGWYETDFKSDSEQKRNIAGGEEGESKVEEVKKDAPEAAKPAEAEAKSGDAKPAAKPAVVKPETKKAVLSKPKSKSKSSAKPAAKPQKPAKRPAKAPAKKKKSGRR